MQIRLGLQNCSEAVVFLTLSIRQKSVAPERKKVHPSINMESAVTMVLQIPLPHGCDVVSCITFIATTTFLSVTVTVSKYPRPPDHQTTSKLSTSQPDVTLFSFLFFSFSLSLAGLTKTPSTAHYCILRTPLCCTVYCCALLHIAALQTVHSCTLLHSYCGL